MHGRRHMWVHITKGIYLFLIFGLFLGIIAQARPDST